MKRVITHVGLPSNRPAHRHARHAPVEAIRTRLTLTRRVLSPEQHAAAAHRVVGAARGEGCWRMGASRLSLPPPPRTADLAL